MCCLCCLFAQKTNIKFLYRFVIKYRFFFQKVQTMGLVTISRPINYYQYQTWKSPISKVKIVNDPKRSPVRPFAANIYLFKVINRNLRKRCEICSKLTIKTSERCHWRRKLLLQKMHVWDRMLVVGLQVLRKETYSLLL